MSDFKNTMDDKDSVFKDINRESKDGIDKQITDMRQQLIQANVPQFIKRLSKSLNKLKSSDMGSQSTYDTLFETLYSPKIYGSQIVSDIRDCYNDIVESFLRGYGLEDYGKFSNCALMKVIIMRYGMPGLLLIIHYLLTDPNKRIYDFEKLFKEESEKLTSDSKNVGIWDLSNTRNFVYGEDAEDIFIVPKYEYIRPTNVENMTVDQFIFNIRSMIGASDYFKDFENKYIPENRKVLYGDLAAPDYSTLFKPTSKMSLDTELDLTYTHLILDYIYKISKNILSVDGGYYETAFENTLLNDGFMGLVHILKRLTDDPSYLDTYITESKKRESPKVRLGSLLQNTSYQIRKRSLQSDTLFEFGTSNNVIKDDILEQAYEIGGESYVDFVRSRIDCGEYMVNQKNLEIVEKLNERILDNLVNAYRADMKSSNEGLAYQALDIRDRISPELSDMYKTPNGRPLPENLNNLLFKIWTK